MQQNRTLRIVKRAQSAQAETGAPAQTAAAAPPRDAERQMRAVVSAWVREHREGAEDMRRAAAHLLDGARQRPAAA